MKLSLSSPLKQTTVLLCIWSEKVLISALGTTSKWNSVCIVDVYTNPGCFVCLGNGTVLTRAPRAKADPSLAACLPRTMVTSHQKTSRKKRTEPNTLPHFGHEWLDTCDVSIRHLWLFQKKFLFWLFCLVRNFLVFHVKGFGGTCVVKCTKSLSHFQSRPCHS